jgi:hypothetical protein
MILIPISSLGLACKFSLPSITKAIKAKPVATHQHESDGKQVVSFIFISVKRGSTFDVQRSAREQETWKYCVTMGSPVGVSKSVGDEFGQMARCRFRKRRLRIRLPRRWHRTWRRLYIHLNTE